MKQNAMQQFKSECGRIMIHIENEVALGNFHDFLMQIKGLMVERMVVEHKKQKDEAEAAIQLPLHESELSAMPDQPQVC